jgi:uncharacterized membrane protein
MKRKTGETIKIYKATHLGFGFWLAILLIVIGFYFIAKDLGIINPEFRIWPFILIVIGIAILISKIRG